MLLEERAGLSQLVVDMLLQIPRGREMWSMVDGDASTFGGLL